MTLEDYMVENNLLHLWGDKNELPPFSYTYGSHKKIWIKCEKNDNHPEYDINVTKFTSGRRCPYCSGKRVIKEDSIACYMNINNIRYVNNESLYNIPKKSNKRVVVRICEEHGEFPQSPNQITRGANCPYCSGQMVHLLNSLGYNNKRSAELWSNKNKLSPYEYTKGSGIKAWWKCENGLHEDYERSIVKQVNHDFRCPTCVAKRTLSIISEKTIEYINSLGFNYKLEHQCSIIPKNTKTKYSMPFDVEIEDINLIVEVHGKQHYIWNTSFYVGNKEEKKKQLHKRKLYDRYKSYIAYVNGYNYLELPYWTFNDETYKTLIDNKIKEIKELNE